MTSASQITRRDRREPPVTANRRRTPITGRRPPERALEDVEPTEENTMHRFRIRAGFAALAVVLIATGCKWTGFNDTNIKSTSQKARNWLVTQQQAGGGFEVSGFDGFETPDAITAIAENAQQQAAWNTDQARAAVRAVTTGGKSALDWADTFAAGTISAGQAAKLIVLVAKPLGLGVKTFDPAGDSDVRNLIAVVNAGAQPNGSYGAFNATLYAALAKSLVDGAVPANTLAYIRGGQQASGGWDFANDPTASDADIDTTSLAIQVLVAAKVSATDTDLVQALQYLAANQQASGAWQAFGADDPNSTATAVMAITAVGGDATSSCWRDQVSPGLSGHAYASPLAWLRTQQAGDGHIASQNDAFPPVNTFGTTQSIQALRRGWLPVAFEAPRFCS